MACNNSDGDRRRRVAEAAERALAEVQARRAGTGDAPRPAELSGPKGPEPTRYGDWERSGIARDF